MATPAGLLFARMADEVLVRAGQLMETGRTRNEAFRITLNGLRPKFEREINETELTEAQRKFALWLIE